MAIPRKRQASSPSPIDSSARQDIPRQTFFPPAPLSSPRKRQKTPSFSSEALTPVALGTRIWMDEPNSIYPILDRLSTELTMLNIQIAMPEARFHQKISPTGWQLYSITGKEEHWAVLNLEQGLQAEKLVEAIQQSGAQVSAKKMKSGEAHAVVIIFHNNISLSAEIDKMIPYIRMLSSSSLTLS